MKPHSNLKKKSKSNLSLDSDSNSTSFSDTKKKSIDKSPEVSKYPPFLKYSSKKNILSDRSIGYNITSEDIFFKYKIEKKRDHNRYRVKNYKNNTEKQSSIESNYVKKYNPCYFYKKIDQKVNREIMDLENMNPENIILNINNLKENLLKKKFKHNVYNL